MAEWKIRESADIINRQFGYRVDDAKIVIGNGGKSMNIFGVNNTLSGMYYDPGKTRKVMEQKKRFTESIQSAEDKAEAKEEKRGEKGDTETDTDIIVMPDGSRVLVITMNMGGMQTSMSLEISKPTALPNDVSQIDDHVNTEEITNETI